MKIGSLDDLKKIKEEYQTENPIAILVGMGTCGISSGAKEIYMAFSEEIASQNINHANVVPVGCIGYCHSEPTVQVHIPDQKPVLYGNVTKDMVQKIIQQHIKGGKPVENLILEMNFVRV